ncbi:hypothetical protein BAE44_0018032 [Dichanthelium oligosanthes]|uniref:AAA+ ATPase domain-containing protein n=1 Tax=Dichanthelium oligosanthes TaxID=888268 RepID=A0A1E5V718_9POAL|nr:hypothetical protein BAE44_0018032 [Dichanthelium oligosanthes]
MAMLLRRRLPLLRLLRPLHTESAAALASSSSTPPRPLQKPHAAASPSVAPGSRRLGFLNATPLASARGTSASSSAAAYLAIGAAAALASLPVVYADGNEQGPIASAVSAGPTEGEDLARKERKRIMELVQSQGMQRGSYPQFDVAVKGQKVVCSFPQFEIEFIKRGSFSLKELEALISALKVAGEKDVKGSSGKGNKNTPRKGNSQRSKHVASMEKIVSDLEAMGVRVYGFDETSSVPMDGTVIWENLAGYEPQKREIEDTILLALQSPQVYDDIARGTRCKFETNRPRAVLFEGPPGTGKTSSARVIAKQAGVPLLYVPLEVVMSKYYGESERLLGSVFSLANDLPEGGIIFLDEVYIFIFVAYKYVDSFAIARDSEMHEATRRILSVILRQFHTVHLSIILYMFVFVKIDGFEQDRRVVVIAATNRKEDLDPALIRMSGRDIRDVCQQAERHWASKVCKLLIRGQVSKDEKGAPTLPPIDEYVSCAEQRRKSLPDRTRRTSRPPALKLA